MKIILKKNNSQNLLIFKKYINKIFKFINLNKNDIIIEIGPGLFSLTKYILKYINSINTIEIDKIFSEYSLELFLNKINVYNINVLNFNFLKFILKKKKKIIIISNIPYNISTKILIKLSKISYFISNQYIMIQKELLDKIISKPGTKKFSKLSIILQKKYKIKYLYNIPSYAFFPKPKINSIFIKMTPTYPILKCNEIIFNKILILAFSNRRKFIYSSFKFFFNKNDFLKLNINYKSRPNLLNIKKYIKITRYLIYISKNKKKLFFY